MNYEESVRYLEMLAPRGWRLGLDRMAEFARRAGLDDNLGQGPTKYVHIAGTNGKGSVTAYVQSLLVEGGFRTGAFFSPYVYDLRERVQFGRDLIPKEDFARIATDLRPVAESFSEADFGGVTEFEFKTAIGFRYWKEMNCEAVALEVGLGGRLDSTNIVDPACSVIVSIGLDHTAILGETLAEIAFEKAGIIKPGRPTVAGDLPREAAEVIEAVCTERASPLWRLGTDVVVEAKGGPVNVTTPKGTLFGLEPGIPGVHQPHNLAVAIAALHAADLLPAEPLVRRGASMAKAPGRMESRTFRGREVILDGAHNADASAALAQSLGNRTFALVTGMVAGHDPVAFYSPIARIVGKAFGAPIDFHRAVPPQDLAAQLRDVVAIDLHPKASVAGAMEAAYETGLPILVTGSFYLVGEVGRFLEEAPHPSTY